MHHRPFTDPERLRSIAEIDDPVRRNLQITQSYHELCLAFAERLHGTDVMWTGFATWASKEAGRFIRNEEVPPILRRFLGLDVRTGWRRFTPWGLLRHGIFLRYVRCTVQDVARHVADGNQLVHRRLARRFGQFLATLDATGSLREAAFEEFLRNLDDDPDLGAEVADAFRAYGQAWRTTDPKLRAEHLLHGNLLIGWHEQQRLQEAIDGALRAPIRRALEDPDRLLTDWPIHRRIRSVLANVFRRLAAPFIRTFEDEWVQAVTSCLMTLSMPDQVLYLGDDLPPLATGDMYPQALEEPTLAPLRATLVRFDRTPSTTHGSAARDWTDLGDRMNFIADYFRSRQQSRTVLAQPFASAQVETIHRGGLPSGPL